MGKRQSVRSVAVTRGVKQAQALLDRGDATTVEMAARFVSLSPSTLYKHGVKANRKAKAAAAAGSRSDDFKLPETLTNTLSHRELQDQYAETFGEPIASVGYETQPLRLWQMERETPGDYDGVQVPLGVVQVTGSLGDLLSPTPMEDAETETGPDDDEMKSAMLRWVKICITRHKAGDWGDICEDDPSDEDWHTNDAALLNGGRIVSLYNISPFHQEFLRERGCRETQIYVITDGQHANGIRSSTSAFFTGDY